MLDQTERDASGYLLWIGIGVLGASAVLLLLGAGGIDAAVRRRS